MPNTSIRRRSRRHAAPPAIALAAPDATAVRYETIYNRDGTVLREPTAVRAEWRDPDDLDGNRRTPRVIVGSRSADTLRTLCARGKLVTLEHIVAGDKLARDYEIGVEGARPNSERSPVGGAFGAGSYPAEVQMLALERYRAAERAIGGRGLVIVAHVVMGVRVPNVRADNRTVRAYAELHGIDERTAMGMLVSALDRLVEHYGISESDPGNDDAQEI